MLKKTVLTVLAVAAMSSTAFAADLPSRKAPPVYIPPPPVFTWTGVYIGAQIGYQWGTSGTDLASALPLAYNANGVTGGAHVGYNYQFNQFVVGLEGDVNGLSYNGTNNLGGGFAFSTRETIDGSVRGRVGYAWDRALIYATGGAAFAGIKNSYTLFGAPTSINATRVGWTVGGGVEYAIDNNWSVRAEYRYTDYGKYSQFPFGFGPFNNHEYDNKVQAGFSYKFDLVNPLPVVAKY